MCSCIYATSQESHGGSQDGSVMLFMKKLCLVLEQPPYSSSRIHRTGPLQGPFLTGGFQSLVKPQGH